MTFRTISAMDIPANGLFIWQNSLWAVIGQWENDPTYVEVLRVASAWTNNPYDRWQFDFRTNPSIGSERFNGYCEVSELTHNFA